MIKKDFEKIFGQLFDNIPLVSIMGCEFDGTVFYWNKTAENLFGYKQDEIVGKNFADVIVPEKLRNKFINCLRESALIKQTDQYSPPIEVELRHKKGNKVPISCYQIKVLREGNDPLLFCLSIDVSEKRNKESKYRRILENMMDVYFFTDNDGIIQFVSDSAAKFYGVNDASDLVGKKALDMYFYPEEREIFYHSLKSSGRVTDEVTLRSQDGKPIITEMTTQYVYDEEGNQIGVDGVLRDVTKRHKTELALRESEVMFRRLFENELDSITILDAQTLDFEDANQATLDLYGYAREEYLSLNARDVTAEPEKTIPSIMKNRDKKRWDRIPLRYHRKKDGTIFPVEISNGVVEINNVKKIIGVVRDITKVKKSEEALKRSEERFRSIFENASTGINITDLSGNYLDVNESFCNMVGYTKEELVEKNFRDITFQDDLKKDIELFDDLLDNKIKNYQLEKRYLHKSGKQLWANLNVSLVKDHDGKPLHFVGQVIDITEKKQSEAKLVEAQKMDSIGSLAGGIAHDFNNMLGGMLGHASLLLGDETDQKRKESIQGIINTAERASDLTKKLLAFGRRGKNLVQAVNINNIIQEVLVILEHSIDKSIDIITEFDKDIYLIDADPSQINQLVMNLCVNAAEAMPDGGTLVIHTHNVDFNRNYLGLPPGKYAFFRVTDTGCGMDNKTMQQIFDPFFTTKTKGREKGTGLGLSTAYGIVKSHGGIIDVCSELGKGSTFRAYFPQGKLSPAKNEEVVRQKGSLAGVVMVVDDEKMIRDMIKKMLERLGYQVMLAKNGFEAVKIYRDFYEKIDVVILDMQMSELSGKQTFIKMKEINPHIRALLSTGYGRNEEAQEILNLGVIDLLPKPYKMDDLAEKINKIIDA